MEYRTNSPSSLASMALLRPASASAVDSERAFPTASCALSPRRRYFNREKGLSVDSILNTAAQRLVLIPSVAHPEREKHLQDRPELISYLYRHLVTTAAFWRSIGVASHISQ